MLSEPICCVDGAPSLLWNAAGLIFTALPGLARDAISCVTSLAATADTAGVLWPEEWLAATDPPKLTHSSGLVAAGSGLWRSAGTRVS